MFPFCVELKSALIFFIQRSYDVILQVKLDDTKALEEYQNDEYHCSVVKKHMHQVAQSSIAIDYEI